MCSRTARSCTRPMGSSRSRRAFAGYLPWILIAVVGGIILVGLIVWYADGLDRDHAERRGLQVDDAVNRMQAQGVQDADRTPQPNSRPVGRRVEPECTANSEAGSGSTVHLHGVLGRGHGHGAGGRPTAGDARDQLVNAGFAVTTAQVNSSQPVGTVVAQDPAAGTKAPKGTKVRINVSKGPGNVPVQSQVGNQVNDARANLTAKGFKPVVTLVPSNRRRAPSSRRLRRAVRRRADRPSR